MLYPNLMYPYWLPSPFLMNRSARGIRRVDVNGIYELSTNAVQLTDASVDYGINPHCYNELPCESIILLKVHADVPAGGEALPVYVITPNLGQTTLATAGVTTGTSKVPVVDSNNNPVTGTDVTGTTERLAYLNKRTGVIRFLEFTASTPAAASNGEPAAASVNAIKAK